MTENIRILVLQRGWVLIGAVSMEGHRIVVENAWNFRRWGTKGVGIGALEAGPRPETELHFAGRRVVLHPLQVLFEIQCDAAAWRDRLTPVEPVEASNAGQRSRKR